MGVINIKKAGLALGLTFVVLRLLCIVLLSVVGHDQAGSFLKTLLCGIDASPLLSMEMSVRDTFFGLVQIFIFGWLVGGLFASFYNISFCCDKTKKSGCCH